MRFDVAPEITHSRFQRALLGVVHDKATVEQHAADLEVRLQEQTEATKAALAEVGELQTRLDEASRLLEEAEQRAAAQRKAHDDERSRQALHARAVTDKANQQQQKLTQQGQQLYTLEEQLRTRTTEVSRLKIEKDGADELIASFQSKLEEVGKVIESTTRAEADCRAAVTSVRADQAELQAQLVDAQRAQRAAAPRAQLERRLQQALRDDAARREREQELTAAVRLHEDECAAAQVRHGAVTARLDTAERGLADALAREATFDAERRSLGEQLAHAQAAALRERERGERLSAPPRVSHPASPRAFPERRTRTHGPGKLAEAPRRRTLARSATVGAGGCHDACAPARGAARRRQRARGDRRRRAARARRGRAAQGGGGARRGQGGARARARARAGRRSPRGA